MKSTIEQALIEQNPHWGGEVYTHPLIRRHDASVINNLSLSEIQVITGIRRCGKSTLLKVLINALSQKVDPKCILYINFDDPNYTKFYEDAALLYDIITLAEKLTEQPIQYCFFDEVQNVEQWEKFVKSIYDNNRFKKIVVTGSNSNLLNSDYAVLLSGRYLEMRLYPLSYSEVLTNAGISDAYTLEKEKATVLKLCDHLIEYGGFPRIHSVDNHQQKRQILKNYYETILLKDCIANNNVRDTKTLSNLAYYFLTHVSSLYSYNNLSKLLGSNENTIQQFVQILQDSHLISEIKQFSYSLKAQITNKKKIYCIDNGLVTATSFTFSNNYGKLLENLVYSELTKLTPDTIYFFNDNKECDFIVHQPNKQLAIQVCYHFNQENRDREIKGLEAAMKKFNIPEGVVITYDDAEIINDSISVIPFWKFFSSDDSHGLRELTPY